MPDFTVIDLETTGLDPLSDAIIEFGAVRFRDGEVVEEFSELADPGRQIPEEISRLTGITDSDVNGKPSSREVLQRFLSFIEGESCLLAHNAEFEAGFIKAAGGEDLEGRLLDTLLFSRIVWPELPRHNLQSLAQYLEFTQDGTHRAAADSAMTGHLWLALQQTMNEFHPAVAETLARLFEPVGPPCSDVFAQLNARMQQDAMVRPGGNYESCFEDFSDYLDALRANTASDAPEELQTLDAARMRNLFSEDGVVSRRFPNFEHRPEQQAMVGEVCEAFNNGRHAMIEAGTGTGKSLAYLIPAIGWAILNQVKLVISTNTKNLQDQLFEKDIPSMAGVLNKPFRAVRLKGASNYLCVRRFLELLRQDEIPKSYRPAVAALAVWAVQTRDGDISQCTGFRNLGGRDILERMGLGGGECMGSSCRQRRRCFIQKARGEAALGDLIIVNHALVFSEVGLETSVLPPYSYMVFDEAHNIENVVTEHLTRKMNRYRIISILNRLHQENEDEGGRGPVSYLVSWFSEVKEDKEIVSLAEDCIDAIETAWTKTEAAFDAIEGLYSPEAIAERSGNQRSEISDRLRYSDDKRGGAAWERVISDCENLDTCLQELERMLVQLRERADLVEKNETFRLASLDEIQWQLDGLAEFCEDLGFLITAADKDYVYWASQEVRGRRTDYALQAAPIDIGELMIQNFFEKKESIVLVSATLTVGEKFDFFKQRLGLDRYEERETRELLLGSCFDFERQALLSIPSFLPEPGYRQRDFGEQLGDLLVDVFGISNGRGLVLCTSYALLREIHKVVKPPLRTQGILVLGQGVDGEPGQIAQIFRADNHSVLVGTQSFWEGFDAPGNTLCCVVVAKIPFPVFTDPIVEARCELLDSRGMNSFMSYMVPSAAIRLKQGFGRLIRQKTDFGVVVLGDKRVLTKPYGKMLLKSLPAQARQHSDRAELLHDLKEFFEGKDE